MSSRVTEARRTRGRKPYTSGTKFRSFRIEVRAVACRKATTEVKLVKDDTRPFADVVLLRLYGGHRQGRQGLVIGLPLFQPGGSANRRVFCFSLAGDSSGAYNIVDMNNTHHPKGVKEMRCSYCGSTDHTVANCRSTWDGCGNRMRLHCEYCGQWGVHNTCCCPRTIEGRNNREDPDHHDHYVLD